MTHALLHLDQHHERLGALLQEADRDRLARAVRPVRLPRVPRLQVTVRLVRPALPR